MAYFIQPLRTPSLQFSHPCSAPLLLLGKVAIENKLEAFLNFFNSTLCSLSSIVFLPLTVRFLCSRMNHVFSVYKFCKRWQHYFVYYKQILFNFRYRFLFFFHFFFCNLSSREANPCSWIFLVTIVIQSEGSC